MKIIDLKNNREISKTEGGLCLLLGNFDGVHRGHTSLVDAALKEGKALGLKTGVWTFADHPANTLSGNGFSYLTDNIEKNRIFGELGVDYVIYEDFSSVRDLSPLQFVKNVLIDKFDCRAAVCGFNFKFGKNGEGTPDVLKETMEAAGRKVVITQPFFVKNTLVSSTEIRRLLEEGKTAEAMELLGRPYSLNVPVEHGKKLGRTLGLPTINQRFPLGRIVPQKGIYACTCEIDGVFFIGVANVGSRPTVNSDMTDVNCETHIINYDGDLYGKPVKVNFYKRMRDEQRFADTDKLKIAVGNDVLNAVEYFSEIKDLIK